MNDEQLLRYSRQIMLPEIDHVGQQQLLNSRVLIAGVGGLGSAASMYLAAAGVGHITLVDNDIVELTNLQRQVVHSSNDLDKNKVDSARDFLLSLNPDIKISGINKNINSELLNELMPQQDVVVDATDNFDTRFAINAGCFKHNVPLVSAAAIRFEGQLGVFNPRDKHSPCYRCLYSNDSDLLENEDQSCANNGVLAPMVGILGCMQALETIKLLTNVGDVACGRLILFDGLAHEWRTVKLKKDPACPVCN